MRVLHVVTAWPRGPEDVITPWLVSLCRRQAERGHEVEVLAPAHRGLGGGSDGGVLVRRFRYAPARWERLTHEETTPDRLARQPAYLLLVPGYLAAGIAAAARLGRRRRYDAVHVHWAIPHGAAGWAAARAAGAVLATTFYGAEIRWAESRMRAGLRFLRWYCRRSHLVAISESTRDALAAHTRRPIDVIPYGVPVPEPAPEGTPRDLDRSTILFVGRLVARKGVDRLLAALHEIEHRPWRLEIVGFGPEEQPLAAQAGRLGLSGRVTFLGRVSHAELAAAYRRADCFVLPATLDERGDTEGLGVVLLEAMSHGVPVVATRRGGIPDIVRDGVTGFLVDDSVAALAGGVARILDDPAGARRMGERGRERVREAFGWEAILDRLEAVYARGPVGSGESYYARWTDDPAYRASRAHKAALIDAVCGERLRAARRVVDLGAGTGIIRKILEERARRPIIGLDIDRAFMADTERMAVADVQCLPLRDAAVDFGIANHVYEHVPDLGRFFDELRRILAPDGAVYLTAGNRYALIEPHYRIPTLAWWPEPVASRLLRWSGRGEKYDDIRFQTHGRLTATALRHGITLVDITDRVLMTEIARYDSRPGGIAARAAALLPAGLRRWLLVWLSPQWFFLARHAEVR